MQNLICEYSILCRVIHKIYKNIYIVTFKKKFTKMWSCLYMPCSLHFLVGMFDAGFFTDIQYILPNS